MLHQKKVKVIENFYFSLSSCSPVHYAKQALSWAAAARWALIHFQYVGGPRCQCTQGIKFKSLLEYVMYSMYVAWKKATKCTFSPKIESKMNKKLSQADFQGEKSPFSDRCCVLHCEK